MHSQVIDHEKCTETSSTHIGHQMELFLSFVLGVVGVFMEPA